MGGRGSAYYEKKNSELEELMRLLKLFKPKQKKLKYKEDPESKRNNYQLFKDLKTYSISTRKSTDTSSLKNLNIHQEKIKDLSKKYKDLIKTIPLENEIEFSKNNSKSSFGYLQTVIFNDGSIKARVSLSKLVIDKNDLFIEKKQKSINDGWSTTVDNDKVGLYTTVHEFGHLLEENLIRKSFKNSNNVDYSYFRETEATKIKNEVIKICKDKYNNGKILAEDDIYISKYAKETFKRNKGDYEWFAETFTNAELSKQPKPIALALKEYLRRI